MFSVRGFPIWNGIQLIFENLMSFLTIKVVFIFKCPTSTTYRNKGCSIFRQKSTFAVWAKFRKKVKFRQAKQRLKMVHKFFFFFKNINVNFLYTLFVIMHYFSHIYLLCIDWIIVIASTTLSTKRPNIAIQTEAFENYISSPKILQYFTYDCKVTSIKVEPWGK